MQQFNYLIISKKMSVLIFLLFIFTIQKDVKENIPLGFDLLNLSSSYDYRIYTSDSSKQKKTLYFLIETELNEMPFDIDYRFRGSNNSFTNISVDHQEKKGNLNAFFFHLEKPDEKDLIIDFNVTNIKGEYALLTCSMFEELNSNIIRIEDTMKENKIKFNKDNPVFILFNTENLNEYSFLIKTSSFNTCKRNIHVFGSNENNINEIFILGRDFHVVRESYILYDNKTYELSPIYGTIGYFLYKSAFIVLEPLVDEEVIIQFKNISNLPYIFAPYYPASEIGHHFWENFRYKQEIYPINCTNYFQDLFYFTLKAGGKYKYYYSNDIDSESDVAGALEFKEVVCKTKNEYEYCEMNRTNLEQKFFYFIVEGEGKQYNLLEFRSTFFDETKYKTASPFSSNKDIIDNSNPNLPLVIGNFEYNQKIYLEISINIPNNNENENNLENIDVYAKLFNEEAENLSTFTLENKDVSLKISLTTEKMKYYLFESNDNYSSGDKSLFFFVNPKEKNPNYNIEYGTYAQKPITYESYSLLINEEKSFTNVNDIFLLSLNLTGISLQSNDNIYITFEGKKDAFSSNIINYSINGAYSTCEVEIQEGEEEKSLKCLIPTNSEQILNFVLNLKKNFQIKVKSEIIYKGNFVDSLSLLPDKKYIISNNAFNNDNYYIFISSNNEFILDDISYNTIESLDNFTETILIGDYKEVKGFNDKRIYVKIKNKDNKTLIGFKTGKIKAPFTITKTKIDESNIQFLNYSEKYEFNFTKNIPLLFVLNLAPKYSNIYLKLSSNVKISYFTNLTYFDNRNEFISFSDIEMYKFDENANNSFYNEHKFIIFKSMHLNNNYSLFGMIINQEIDGKLELEILENLDEINKFTLKDDNPYDLKKGINLIKTDLNDYNEYNFILKYFNNISSNNIEIYKTNENEFESNKTALDNIEFDTINDTTYTYNYFNFSKTPYLIIFHNGDSKITLRQSKLKENDINKYYNLDEKIIEVKNTNKIILISGIDIDNLNNDIYYFKYSLDSKYYDQLDTKWYIDNEENIDNIVDFYKREKSNIKPIKNIKYNDKIDIYLETYNLQSIGKKSAILMFNYNNSSNSLIIDLDASKKPLYTFCTLKKSLNTNYEISSKVFFIDLILSNFKDDNYTYILFEIKGSKSAFNSTQIYINNLNESQTEIYSNYNNCKLSNEDNEISLLCNYTKNNPNNSRFMILLNKGQKITIRNYIEEEDGGNPSGNNSLNYFYYIGIPVIVVMICIIIAIFVIRSKKNKERKDEAITALAVELNNNLE